MAISDNNLRVPDQLWAEAAEIAARQGRTTEDLAVEALRRYVAHERLEELSRFGQDRAREMGLDRLSEDEREAYVEGVISKSRQERGA